MPQDRWNYFDTQTADLRHHHSNTPFTYTVQASSTSNRIASKCNHRHFNRCTAFIRIDVHANENAFYYFIDHIQIISITIKATFHSYSYHILNFMTPSIQKHFVYSFANGRWFLMCHNMSSMSSIDFDLFIFFFFSSFS